MGREGGRAVDEIDDDGDENDEESMLNLKRRCPRLPAHCHGRNTIHGSKTKQNKTKQNRTRGRNSFRLVGRELPSFSMVQKLSFVMQAYRVRRRRGKIDITRLRFILTASQEVKTLVSVLICFLILRSSLRVLVHVLPHGLHYNKPRLSCNMYGNLDNGNPF